MIRVDEYPLGRFIIYDLLAETREEIDEYLEKIEYLYPPIAYDTHFEWTENHLDGWYQARIKRSQSCD